MALMEGSQVCWGGWWPHKVMLHDTGTLSWTLGRMLSSYRGLPGSLIPTQSSQELGSLQGSHPEDAHTATARGALVIYLAKG